MGVWGAGSFENDDALDWIWELETSADFALLDTSLDAVLNASPGEMGASDWAVALAAAEIVAALGGRPEGGLPEEAESWVAGKSTPPASLTVKARAAVAAASADSELRDLWEEARDLETWRASVAELEGRLG